MTKLSPEWQINRHPELVSGSLYSK